MDKIDQYAQDCEEANCEENDYTVYSYEELEYEYGLTKENVAKKLSFLENQVRVRWFMNIPKSNLSTVDCGPKYDKPNTYPIGGI